MVNIVGDGNTKVLTPNIIAGMSLARLKAHLILPLLIDRKFQSYFADKIGDTITIKRPFYTSINKGRVIDSSDYKALIDRFVTLKVDERWNWPFTLTDTDMTLHIVDFARRYLDSGANEFAYRFDIAGFEELLNGSGSSDALAPEALTLQSIAEIRGQYDSRLIPTPSYMIIPPSELPSLHADIVRGKNDTSRALFAPKVVSQAMKKGYVGDLSGFDIYYSVNMPYMETAPGGGTPKVNTNVSTGYEGDMLPTDGWTPPVSPATSTVVMKKGQLFSITGIQEKETRGARKVLPYKKTFTVLEDAVTTDGTAVIHISPEINAGKLSMTKTGAFAATPSSNDPNISLSDYQNASMAAIDNANITRLGDAAKSYNQAVFFSPDCLEYVNIHLASLQSPRFSRIEDPETGLSMSFIGDSDFNTASDLGRLDCFFGVGNIYPELAIRKVIRVV